VAAMNRLLPTLSLVAGGVLILIAIATGRPGRPGAVRSQPS
jgi:hypothetical protein